MNTQLPTRYRLQSRPGSFDKRNAHSSPAERIQRGARRLRPARKSNAAPTHTTGTPISFAHRAAHVSCFGADTPSHTMSARDSTAALTSRRLTSFVPLTIRRAACTSDGHPGVAFTDSLGEPFRDALASTKQEEGRAIRCRSCRGRLHEIRAGASSEVALPRHQRPERYRHPVSQRERLRGRQC